VGLDIGTTKICCLVAEQDGMGGIEVKGFGLAPSTGMRKGMVVNIERTVSAIRQAVGEAERMAGCGIESAMVGIAGGHIASSNHSGCIGVKGKEISAEDIKRVQEAALILNIQPDRQILHSIPQSYKVDGQIGIDNPEGMIGVKLEVNVHVITGAVNAVQNLVNCALRAGLNVEDIVLESVASAEAVLTQEEKQHGVALLDFGGGTTDIAVFSGNSLQHTAVLAMGGDILNSDLSFGLRASTEIAEKLKMNYGYCYESLANDEILEVQLTNESMPEHVRRKVLCDILEPRIKEIMNIIKSEFEKKEQMDNISEIILTGGSSLLEGLTELSREIFSRPVRRGYPFRLGGLSDMVSDPKFATVVGLALCGLKAKSNFLNVRKDDKGGQNLFSRIVQRLKNFVNSSEN
jgi:cell division protein FtsA